MTKQFFWIEIIDDEIRPALEGPLRLIAAEPMLQIEDRVALVGVFLIIRWRVDIRPPLGAGFGGVKPANPG